LRRKSRQYHKPHVEEDWEGNWLISYADLMTLLWFFFVILTAFSTPDVAKVEKLKEATATSMGGKYDSPYNELTDRLKIIIADLKLEKKCPLIFNRMA
jgi:flagellar motor protein MotB